VEKLPLSGEDLERLEKPITMSIGLIFIQS